MVDYYDLRIGLIMNGKGRNRMLCPIRIMYRTLHLPHKPNLPPPGLAVSDFPCDLDIQFPWVILMLFISYFSIDDRPFLKRLRLLTTVIDQQRALPPMCSRPIRTRRERYHAYLLRQLLRSCTRGIESISRAHEEGIKPYNEAIKTIRILLNLQREWTCIESQISYRRRVQRQLSERRRWRW